MLGPEKNLQDYCDGNKHNLTIFFMDLGPQVYYKTLFFWEYLGPLLIYPIFYYLPVYQYLGNRGQQSMHPEPMPCSIGAFTTPKECWKHSLFTGLAMPLLLFSMLSETVFIIGLLAHT